MPVGVQLHNAESVGIMSTYFRLRHEPLWAWGDVVSVHLMLPHLRGFWPLSSIDEIGNVYDLSGQVRTLTDANSVVYAVEPALTHIATFDPTNSDRLFRADEPGLAITLGLTLGGWFKFASLPADSTRYSLISKQGGVGNYGYSLYVETDTGQTRIWLSISVDGTVLQVCSGPDIVSADQWYHVVARFDPGVEMSIWQNGVEGQCDSAIPVSTFASTADFEIGSDNGGANFYDGKGGLFFVCASAIPEYMIECLYWVSSPLFLPKDRDA